jgi:hypothetical protein
MLLRNTFFVPGSSPDSPAWMVSSLSILLRRPHFNPMMHNYNTFKLRLLTVALMLANLSSTFSLASAALPALTLQNLTLSPDRREGEAVVAIMPLPLPQDTLNHRS